VAAASTTAGTAAAAAVSVAAGTDTVPTPETLTDSAAPSLVKGLLVIGEERGNSLTLVGSPKQVEFAEAQLARLDTRKRQVVVNVRIVDVNLLRDQSFSTQASFGVNDSFFTIRDGVGVANFGSISPAPISSSGVSPTVANNPLTGAGVFFDPKTPSTIGGVTVFNPQAGVATNPFQPGITAFTPPSSTTTIATDGTATTVNTSGSVVYSLATLVQYPLQFLSRLQAQITSGNAKILTDPTLLVQEGESASIALTQQVPAGSEVKTETANGVTTVGRQFKTAEAGLTLNIQVERIDDNGFVNMSISPSVSAPTQTITNPDGSLQALISKRLLNSGKIRLRDGQTLILSGVIQDSERETLTKVPILGDIPLLGALFRGSQSQSLRSEVIIVVTPRIMDDSQNSNFGYSYQPGAEVQKVLDSNQIKPQ
jgi:type IV pilus assembly protein PilQ